MFQNNDGGGRDDGYSYPYCRCQLTKFNADHSSQIFSLVYLKKMLYLWSYQLFQIYGQPTYTSGMKTFPDVVVDVAHPTVRYWIDETIARNGGADYCAH